MMRSCKTILIGSVLIVAQVLGSLGFIATGASAQSEQLVAVIAAEKNRDACEVITRRSDSNDNWGANSQVGNPVACEGGLVTTLITTQAEADQQVAAAEASTASTDITVVPLTGDSAADEATIIAETTALHEQFAAGGVTTAEEDPLGFMSPAALENLPLVREAPSASVLAQQCRSGKVGQWRRRDVEWRARGADTYIRANIYYKRISCARWKITDVTMKLTQPPSHDRVWFRNFYYTRTWLGDHYGSAEAGKQCWTLHSDRWINFEPNWQIQANGSAKIEAIDANPNSPGTVPSCYFGAGTSYTSAWVYLPGGTS